MAFPQTIRAAALAVRSNTTSIRPAVTTGTMIGRRWYRGESGEMKHRKDVIKETGGSGRVSAEVTAREDALLAVAMPRAEEIFIQHTNLPSLDAIPKASLPPDMNDSLSSKTELELEVRKKRLVYRSKQRGWLEVDLLLGTWASTFVPTLNINELDDFERFVNMETIDIYNIITLRVEVPEEIKTQDGSGIVERIQEWARGNPLGKDPVEYSKVKKEHNLI